MLTKLDRSLYNGATADIRCLCFYTTINKLQEQGFVIESNKVISEDNRVRIYYRITDDGLIHLERLKLLYAELDQVIWSVVYNKDLSESVMAALYDGGNNEQNR